MVLQKTVKQVQYLLAVTGIRLAVNITKMGHGKTENNVDGQIVFKDTGDKYFKNVYLTTFGSVYYSE
ncbi:MAG: hypothetical protein CVU89_09665 [Firmicutes bacterium HGW-Firmicutes-14]|jgi:hypothetical protein|nr:MAG: hypothetical protein CVU89_09665 [Firmicutes bacterium HGW-Firmicutes-14]